MTTRTGSQAAVPSGPHLPQLERRRLSAGANAMSVVRYEVIDGEIIAEKRAGVRKLYVPDAIGNIVALVDNTQTITDTFTYWPYGEESDGSGPRDTQMRFGGTLGVRRDNAS